MTDDLMQGAFAVAYREAQERDALEREREEQEKEKKAALAAELHVYDPRPYAEAEPHDPQMYKGTGIGALYGLPGCERFLAELGDWRLT